MMTMPKCDLHMQKRDLIAMWQGPTYRIWHGR